MNLQHVPSISNEILTLADTLLPNDRGDVRRHDAFLNLRVCLFQELEASEELDTICPKAPKLEER